ncbi:hypothetical protein D3C72_969480 [compost metagenome]
MTVSETWLPSSPDNRALATPPSRLASRDPIENMAWGWPPGIAAVAVRRTVTLSRCSTQRPKNSGAGAVTSTRAALGSAAPGVNRSPGVMRASAT